MKVSQWCVITFSRSCGGTGLEEDTLLMDLLRDSLERQLSKFSLSFFLSQLSSLTFPDITHLMEEGEVLPLDILE